MPFLSGHEDVQMEEIRWIEAAGECVCLHTARGSRIVRQTLEEVERELDAVEFIRVHESAIVRREQVRGLRMLSGGDGIVEMDGGAEVRVGHKYFSGLASWG